MPRTCERFFLVRMLVDCMKNRLYIILFYLLPSSLSFTIPCPPGLDGCFQQLRCDIISLGAAHPQPRATAVITCRPICLFLPPARPPPDLSYYLLICTLPPSSSFLPFSLPFTSLYLTNSHSTFIL